MPRHLNFQSIAWFWDLHKRSLLDLDPPYQRRSVWNQEYKDYFIDTILNNYPAPAIFLYQTITPDGVSKYSVVDGKQRLSAIFDFVHGVFPVGEKTSISRLKDKYFKDLDNEIKAEVWRYQFAVEYMDSSEESIISNIFDRINRNVAKLTAQELRHARFGGVFINEAEDLGTWMLETLPKGFPAISQRLRKQMKDVEIAAQLLLLLEEGVKSYSQDDLDEAFSERDESWEQKETVASEFRRVIEHLATALTGPTGAVLIKSRLRNQADFYSLFGAFHSILRAGGTLDEDSLGRLTAFIDIVENEDLRKDDEVFATAYYEAARSASNDIGPRTLRIKIIRLVLSGKAEDPASEAA